MFEISIGSNVTGDVFVLSSRCMIFGTKFRSRNSFSLVKFLWLQSGFKIRIFNHTNEEYSAQEQYHHLSSPDYKRLSSPVSKICSYRYLEICSALSFRFGCSPTKVEIFSLIIFEKLSINFQFQLFKIRLCSEQKQDG